METVRRCWQETVLAGADWRSQAVEASYGRRPPDAATAIELATLRLSTNPPPSDVPATPAAAGYDLLEEIGRGGMGVVYRGRQRNLDRDVAVKTISPKLGDRMVAHFVTEARVTGSLSHPNILPVYDLGVGDDGKPFLAMKLVGGRPWSALLHPKTESDEAAALALDFPAHLGILIAVCNAVAYAHQSGVIHRDLKPSNVMVGEFGEVLLMDWGLALKLDSRSQAHAESGPVGTPVYMSPELAVGDVPGHGPWTDIYLLGGILHEIISGRPPHGHSTLPEVIDAAIRSSPPSFTDETPLELQQICSRAMARDPRERHPSAIAFRDALTAFLRHRESIAISDSARGRLQRSRSKAESDEAVRHEGFSRAVAGFEQALVLWPQNPEAISGLAAARLDWAGAALAAGDLALAEAQLRSLAVDDERVATTTRAVAVARDRRLRATEHARRTKIALIAAGLLLFASVATGLIVVSIEQGHTRRALEGESAARGRAEQRAVDIRKLTQSLVYEVHDAVEKLPGATPVRATLAARAVEVLDKLAAESTDDPTLIAELSAAYERVAAVQGHSLTGHLGQASEALKTFEKALALRTRAATLAPANEDNQRAVAIVNRLIGEALVRLDRMREAHEHYEAAQKLIAAVEARNPDHPLVLRDRAGILERRADLAKAEGRIVEALEIQRECTRIANRILQLKPGDPEAKADLTGSLLGEAQLLWLTGRAGESIDVARRTVAMQQELLAAAPNDAERRRSLTISLEALAEGLVSQGQMDEAIKIDRNVVTARRKLSTDDPANVQARSDLGSALFHLGDALMKVSEFNEAMAAYKEWQVVAKECAALDPGDSQFQRDVVLSDLFAAQAQLALGDPAGANAVLGRALENAEKRTAAEPKNANSALDAVQIRIRRAEAFTALGDDSSAVAELERGLGYFLPFGDLGGNFAALRRTRAHLLERYGDLLQTAGDLDGAQARFAEAMNTALAATMRDGTNVEAIRDAAVLATKLGGVLEGLGRLPEAGQRFREALTSMERAIAASGNTLYYRDVGTIRHLLGSVCQSQKQFDSARESFDASIAAFGKAPTTDVLTLRELALAHEKRAGLRQALDEDPLPDLEAASASMARAQKLVPDNQDVALEAARYLGRRAEIVLARGDARSAESLQRLAHEMLESFAGTPGATASLLNALAWMLLTDKPDSVRNAARALELALLAVRATEGRHAGILDTLALAYFENGQRRLAIETERKALALLADTPSNAATRAEFQANLDRFQAPAAESRP